MATKVVTRSRLAVAGLLSAALTASWAIAPPSASGAPTEAELEALHDAKQRWVDQRARDYGYTLRLDCFCPARGPVRIKVVDRKPRGTPRWFDQADTAKELFAVARRALDSEGSHSVRYRPRLGLPRFISADTIVNAVDDEYSYSVTKLRITRRYPKPSHR